MKKRILSPFGRLALIALLGMLFLPVTAFAQRTWVVRRPHRNRVVIYQPRPPVIYQRRPAYTYRYNRYDYSQPYYSNGFYSYGYSQPYYSNGYYSSGYTRPYRVNRYTYAPAYRYGYGYRPRYRRSGLRIGISLR